MNTTSITRRNFIKRTAATAVAVAFAVSAFESYAFTDPVTGSCYCEEVTYAVGDKITQVTLIENGSYIAQLPTYNPKKNPTHVNCPNPAPGSPTGAAKFSKETTSGSAAITNVFTCTTAGSAIIC